MRICDGLGVIHTREGGRREREREREREGEIERGWSGISFFLWKKRARWRGA